MNRICHVSLSGPENGKPQRGTVVWLRFAHRDEKRARELARILSDRIARQTGFDIETTVETMDLVEESERHLLDEVDRLAAVYGDPAVEPRRNVEAEITCLDESAWSAIAGEPDPSGLADRLLNRLRDEYGVEPSDWIVAAQDMPYDDRGGEWRRARVTLSLPADQADLLMGNAAAVSGCSLRIVEDPETLHDDDARMEEIAADAEDAALNAWGPLGSPRRRANPHPDGSEEARYWDATFMSAYARENGR
jgi:hypothetical protein